MESNLCVIVPVFNEAPTLDLVLTQILAQDCVDEVLIVDDGSKDGSDVILQHWRKRNSKIKLFSHKNNLGKGAAIATARKHITAKYTLIQDADLEYSPNNYQSLLSPLREEIADVVYGTRFHRLSDCKIPLKLHLIGNLFLTWVTNQVTGLKLTDMATCYKLLPSELLRNLVLRETGFAIDPEITLRLSEKTHRIMEVPIQYRGRSKKEGKKIRIRDGFTYLRCLLWS